MVTPGGLHVCHDSSKRTFVPQDSAAIEESDSKEGRQKVVADTTGAPETNQNAAVAKDFYQSEQGAQHRESFNEINADHSTTGDPRVQVGDGNPVGGIENPPEPHASEQTQSRTVDVSTEFLYDTVGLRFAVWRRCHHRGEFVVWRSRN